MVCCFIFYLTTNIMIAVLKQKEKSVLYITILKFSTFSLFLAFFAMLKLIFVHSFQRRTVEMYFLSVLYNQCYLLRLDTTFLYFFRQQPKENLCLTDWMHMYGSFMGGFFL